MADDVAKRRGDALDEEAIAKAHAIYTPSMLSIYDLLVHGVSNHLAWRCPTRKLFEPYRANLSANHLEAGVGRAISTCMSRCKVVSPCSALAKLPYLGMATNTPLALPSFAQVHR